MLVAYLLSASIPSWAFASVHIALDDMGICSGSVSLLGLKGLA